jgi:nucleotide-binding universal stress UspA family protein
MPATRQLLVGFDGSPAACIALRRAAHIARHDNACLTILLALGVPRLAAASVFTGAALPLELLERDASDELRRAVAELPADISVASLVVHGAAGPALAREAKRLCADAIVIGSRRGICTRLTGGVARYLRLRALKSPKPHSADCSQAGALLRATVPSCPTTGSPKSSGTIS